MTSTDRKDLKVGIFVFLGIALLMFTIIMIGGDKVLFSTYNTYKVKFTQVQGLQKGAVVSLAGIEIGNVARIRFSDDNKVVVYLDINTDFTHRITQSAVASVRTQGALGDQFILIRPGNTEDERIKVNHFIPSDDRAGFLDVISEKGSDIGNIINVVNEVHTLLKGLNHNGRAALAVERVSRAAERLDSVLLEAELFLRDVRGTNPHKTQLKQTFKSLAQILSKIDRGDGTLGEIINNPVMHNRIMKILGEQPREKYIKPLIRATIKESDKTN
jgi:phospholipid/cholesterol/gamma-HCH transport system substrate-binding protein